ncbi:hypothetical protein ABB37_01655 [Leptomonas pyrrhocoris]|uniref:Uncharacterized protein n=1 Tax=Leptomonas pyrrhocoris TaxID=157538 RepID=A0A0N0DZK7_LEPPY|nr:hypothetical protein ABB37_01655 [Leptomonas pyrrhocoris]XP_015663762.1 hypothetical protein ABB37_01655 [Leptomonas pyrrhocoris]KPA85322.1 hypothetical protein ABB37_01655 [Leptomonas pyrrhocoris]KPA85323.1 hypothetical protein ABB37_01655 [Leptomonas pyrrhocoris]|eukprot:XP_015663761.1 hypothetical protein ABB37_01655 [Leptomonas pyrrhocoris]
MPPKASPTTSKEAADPMLQDTYLQDDTKDFEPSTNEIAAFEDRLQHGGAATTSHGGHPRRHTAPVAEPARPANHVAPAASHQHSVPSSSTAGAASAAQRGNGQRRLSEAEQEEDIQRKEDVDDVRHLDNNFGGVEDDSD